MTYFLQGLMMGFAYVAPIGLQNLFLINTALTQKRSRLIQIVLVIIFFDATLAFACFYGIGAIMEYSRFLKMAVLLIGSLIVMYIGVQLIRTTEVAQSEVDANIPLLRAISMACAVTWFNPQALIDGSMMLGAFKAILPPEGNTPFIAGVIIASVIWFIGVSTLVSAFSARFTDPILRKINLVCGLIILFYGIKLAYNFVELLTL